MKKGIEVYTDYDKQGRWMLVVEKKRGKLTLDEIKDAAREYDYDFYLLVLDCFHDEGDEAQFSGPPTGSRVILYHTDLFYTEDER